MHEMETRIINIDINDIRKKLKNIKAVKVKQENQINNIYDFPDKKLLNDKGYARIRIVDDKLLNITRIYMTTKKCLVKKNIKLWRKTK